MKEKFNSNLNAATEIYFSKTKLGIRISILAFAIVLCSLGLTLGTLNALNNILVWTGLTLCCIGLIYFLYRVFDKSPGILITNKCIVNNLNFIGKRVIEWREITNITTLQFQTKSKRSIVISLENSNGQKSSVNISTELLQITHDELETMLQNEFLKYKESGSIPLT